MENKILDTVQHVVAKIYLILAAATSFLKSLFVKRVFPRKLSQANVGVAETVFIFLSTIREV